MEEHVFRGCELYEDQRATIMDILSENRKEEYLESVTELIRLGEKRFMQGICNFTKFLNLLKKKKNFMCEILIYESRDNIKKSQDNHCDRIRCLEDCYRGPDGHY